MEAAVEMTEFAGLFFFFLCAHKCNRELSRGNLICPDKNGEGSRRAGEERGGSQEDRKNRGRQNSHVKTELCKNWYFLQLPQFCSAIHANN